MVISYFKLFNQIFKGNATNRRCHSINGGSHEIKSMHSPFKIYTNKVAEKDKITSTKKGFSPFKKPSGFVVLKKYNLKKFI